MAVAQRPLSLLQPPSTSDRPVSSADHLTPLRRSRSPVTGHYKRFSAYNLESSNEDIPLLSRPYSLIRSASFSSMGFGFKERLKEKEKELPHPRKTPDSPVHSLEPSPKFAASSSARASPAHSLFTRHRPRGLKKKRSLASLLSTTPEGPSTAGTSITLSSLDIGVSSPQAGPSTQPSSATKAQKTAEQDSRKEEYRQLQLEGFRAQPASKMPKKNTWAKRLNMTVYPVQPNVTYMQAYDPILLENDRHLDILLRRLNPLYGPSFHDYGTKVPFYILDLGCGSGNWLLEAATTWAQSSITGFDLVDILTPEVRSQENIQFVQGNFLKKPWPFPNKSFDFVRMANLSLCIPYQKWEIVLSEVQRVLTIDGRLELIDDQIFFPYAPAPTRPMSTSKLARVSFDIDDDIIDNRDIGDADSVCTESTLISDGGMSCFSHENSEHEPNHDAGCTDISRTPTLPSVDDTCTPISVDTIGLAENPIIPHSSPWSRDAAACRDLETIFENMLHRKYGVHSRPSEFIVDLLQHVFGNGEKLASYHLKLAPGDVYTASGYGNANANIAGSTEGGSDKEEKLSYSEPKKVSQMINEIRKPWFHGDLEKEKKRFKKLMKAHSLTTGFPMGDFNAFPADNGIPEGLSPKAAGRLGISESIPKDVTRIPENLSAKAASRLGIPFNNEHKSEDTSMELSPVAEEAADGQQGTLSVPPITVPVITERKSEDGPTSLPTTEGRLSAKAANRLGISYSALTVAAAASTRRPQSSSSTLVSNPSVPSQSPGLIVWPSKFIPFSPSELEMHACKNIHTLLGCKPALAEYIENFVDENGLRLQSDDEFDQAIWDYECFRRRRFGWPSEIPEWDTEPDTETLESTPTNKPASTPRSANFRTSIFSDTSLILPVDFPETPPLYTHDELTHVRTLRVYQAVKTGEYSLSSLQFPRSPPIPPH